MTRLCTTYTGSGSDSRARASTISTSMCFCEHRRATVQFHSLFRVDELMLLHLAHVGPPYRASNPAAFVLVRTHRAPASIPAPSRITLSTPTPQSCSPTATFSLKRNSSRSLPVRPHFPHRIVQPRPRPLVRPIVSVNREFRPSLPLSIDCRRIIELPPSLNRFTAVQPFRCRPLLPHSRGPQPPTSVSIKVRPAPPALHSTVLTSLASTCVFV